MTATLHTGDCLEVMRGLPDNSIDSIVTDPPYGISFMGKAWDKGVPSVEVWRYGVAGAWGACRVDRGIDVAFE